MPSIALTWRLALLCALVACRNDGPGATAAEAGSALLVRGDNAGAVAAFDRAIALDPGLADAYRNRGVAYRNLKRYDRAIRDYDEAIRLDPTSAGTYNSRGFALQLMQEYDRSIEDFDRAIALDSGFAQARKSRGRSRFYLGQFAEAVADLTDGRRADTANLYLPIWIHMANSRYRRADTARLAAHVAPLDLKPWPGPVAEFFLGRIDEQAFITSASHPDSAVQANQRCAVAFYLGEYLLWQPASRAAEARARLEEAVATCPKEYSEYLGAKSELERMPPVDPGR
jgi:lipoprotein NlpI